MRTMLWVIALVAACTHHRDLREAHEVEGDVEVEINKSYEVDAVASPAPGGVVFVTRAGQPIAPQHVSRVSDTSHGWGALKGLGYGALIGAGTGALVGYSSGDDDGVIFSTSAEEKAVIGGVLLGITGGVVGLVAGAIKGETTIYENRATGTAVRTTANGVAVRF